MKSLRGRQIDALKQVFNLNEERIESRTYELQWKVLIYDQCGQDIISPLFSVGELRELGVTLHMRLHSSRQSVPEVPAVYFVYPTKQNIERICEDFRDSLYESYHLNFIAPIPRNLLEDIAMGAIRADCVEKVAKVFDQYMSFCGLDEDLFVLKSSVGYTDLDEASLADSFYHLNRGGVKDTDIERTVDLIVEGLFSVFVTLGTVPIIQCPRGNAAEMVADKLDQKIRDHLRDPRSSPFSAGGSLSFQRPLLVVVDRTMDLATPFHHSWTYQALVHDVLEYRNNSVTLRKKGSIGAAGDSAATASEVKATTYDLNPSDPFWVRHRGSPFPNVAEAVQGELEKYRSREEQIKQLKTSMGLEGEDEATVMMMSESTAKLTDTVNSLPALLDEKRRIDLHTNVATAVLDEIKRRHLDTFFELEEKIFSKQTLDRSLLDLFTDAETGTPDDKVRLFLIALLCGQPMSDSDISQYVARLNDSGAVTEAVEYVHWWMRQCRNPQQLGAVHYNVAGGVKTESMFPRLMSNASKFLMEGVKNLVVRKQELPFTRILDSLMQVRPNKETEQFRYFDPKLLNARQTAGNGEAGRPSNPFTEAVLFVVGGGNYIEYQNLVDYAKGKPGQLARRILYGSTDLCNGDQFLRQLSKLGQELAGR